MSECERYFWFICVSYPKNIHICLFVWETEHCKHLCVCVFMSVTQIVGKRHIYCVNFLSTLKVMNHLCTSAAQT